LSASPALLERPLTQQIAGHIDLSSTGAPAQKHRSRPILLGWHFDPLNDSQPAKGLTRFVFEPDHFVTFGRPNVTLASALMS
jgi:hypothetical protein